MIKGLIVSFFLISNFSWATEIIRSYRIQQNSPKLESIASQFEIVKKDKDGFEVYVPEEKVSVFRALDPKAKLLESNIHSLLTQNKILELNKYKKFVDVESTLKNLAAQYNNIVSLESYGQSKLGRNLYSLKVSLGDKENKPKLLVTAATHGDELITTEVLFTLLLELLEGLPTNSRFSKILANCDLYFIPVVSPDSFENRERYVQGIDPNRSFPWPENLKNKSVDVIKALMDYTDRMKFTGTLDLHAYGKLVMFPWSYTKNAPEAGDDIGFKDLVQTMARDNGYESGQISKTIYVAKGSSADYFYWKNGAKAIAVEIGSQKIPDYSRIPMIANEAREMLWSFFEFFN